MPHGRRRDTIRGSRPTWATPSCGRTCGGRSPGAEGARGPQAGSVRLLVRHRLDSRRARRKERLHWLPCSAHSRTTRWNWDRSTSIRRSRRSRRNQHSRPSCARWDADAGRDRPLVAGPVGRASFRAAGSGDDRGPGHGPDRGDRTRRHHHGHGRHRGGHPDQDECRRALRAGPARHRTVPGLDRSARIQAGGQRRDPGSREHPRAAGRSARTGSRQRYDFGATVRLRSSRPTRPPCRTRSALRRSISCR